MNSSAPMANDAMTRAQMASGILRMWNIPFSGKSS